MDGYTIDRMYMNDNEIAVLRKLSAAMKEDEAILTSEERMVLDSIISLYAKPKI